MLTVEDIQRLFTHCRKLHPFCPPDKIPRLSRELANSWVKALEGYSYEEVAAALEKRAEENRYWPNLSEVLPYLRKLRKAGREHFSPSEWEEIERMNKAYRETFHAAGLPTLTEAAAQGMSWREWEKRTESVQDEAIRAAFGFCAAENQQGGISTMKRAFTRERKKTKRREILLNIAAAAERTLR